jgi:hypothetical protein
VRLSLASFPLLFTLFVACGGPSFEDAGSSGAGGSGGSGGGSGQATGGTAGSSGQAAGGSGNAAGQSAGGSGGQAAGSGGQAAGSGGQAAGSGQGGDAGAAAGTGGAAGGGAGGGSGQGGEAGAGGASGQGGDAGASGAGGKSDTAAICNEAAKAQCGRLDECEFQTATRAYGSAKACIDHLRQSCVLASNAPGSSDTSALRMKCTAAIKAATCAVFNEDGPVPGCDLVTGTLPIGQGCAFNAQCKTGYCALSGGASCGQCAALPQLGDSCIETRSCGPGSLRCQVDAEATPPAARCIQAGHAGDACDRTIPCDGGFSCVGANFGQGIKGTCVLEQTTVGAPCDPTKGPLCDRNAGLTCDASSKMCGMNLLASPGEACGTVGKTTVLTECQGGSTCIFPAKSAVGACVINVADGSPCGPAVGSCSAPSHCAQTNGGDALVCALPDAGSCP